MRKIIIFLLALFYSLSMISMEADLLQQTSLPTILTSYQQALKNLISDAKNRKIDIDLSQSSVIFATYKKIIAPYVAYISGYAQVITQEIARKFPYDKDLQIMSGEFAKNEKEVLRVIQLFPVAKQKQLRQYFYEQLAENMVQVCYQIVQQTADARMLSDSDISVAYIAYQLAFKARTPDMKFADITSSRDFESKISSSMISLLQAALVARNNSLKFGVSEVSQNKTTYQEIVQYHKMLHQIYIDTGQQVQAQAQQKLMQVVQQTSQNQSQAMTLMLSAQKLATQARQKIALSISNVSQIKSLVIQSIEQLGQANNLYQQAEKLFEVAGAPQAGLCKAQQNIIMNIDLRFRGVQELWNLFLTSQASVSLQDFLKQASSDSMVNIITVLQNLEDLCVKVPNVFNQSLAILPLLHDAETWYDSTSLSHPAKQNNDLIINMTLLKDGQLAVHGLHIMLQSIIHAIKSKKMSDVAIAMTQAQNLDALFQKNDELRSCVAYLPDFLDENVKSWELFAAKILLGSKVVTSIKQAQVQVGKAVITKGKSAIIKANTFNQLKNQGQSFASKAKAAEVDENFALAMQNYASMLSIYKRMLPLATTAADENATKSVYFLVDTLWTASSLASSVQTVEGLDVGKLTQVPSAYLLSEFNTPSINISLLGAEAPAWLSSFTLAAMTADQKAFFVQIWKAYILEQILKEQGASFLECFSDYTAVIKPGISQLNEQYARQALQILEPYEQQFGNMEIADAQVSAIAITLSLRSMPIPAVTSWYASYPCAADYFLAAHSLFQPGKEILTLSGVSYVPGQDLQSAQIMLQKLAYAYVSQAQYEILMMGQFMAQVSAAIKQDSTIFPKNFATLYPQIKRHMLRAQALLSAQDQSAYAYFMQAQAFTLAAQVKMVYINLYKTALDFMKKCLIGSPFDQRYNSLLRDVNIVYLEWMSELDPTKDATQIAQINQDIVQLFVQAGQLCLKMPYEQAEYPSFKQIHYDAAVQYFIAAQKKYESLGDKVQASALESHIHQGYYLGCDQNLELYFYVKNHGISYISSTTGKAVSVTFDQLCKDYLEYIQGINLNIDTAEINAYQKVKDLLLDAAMVYDFLANNVAKSTVKTTGLKSSKNAVTGQQKVLLFLQQHNVIGAHVLAIPYQNAGVKEKILVLAQVAYQNFQKDSQALAAWLNVLILTVQNLYIADFLGGSTHQTSKVVEQQVQEFFQAVQKSALALQNPSSAYVG